MVESAISRSETTGFLSLSRSTVSCEPDEIIRARCAASKTRSNRLSTLSMQSSTVTRAIACRSVNGAEYVGYSGLVIAPGRISQGNICDLRSRRALLTPSPRGPDGRSIQTQPKCRLGQVNCRLQCQKSRLFALAAP